MKPKIEVVDNKVNFKNYLKISLTKLLKCLEVIMNRSSSRDRFRLDPIHSNNDKYIYEKHSNKL